MSSLVINSFSEDEMIIQYLQGRLGDAQLTVQAQRTLDQMDVCEKLIRTHISRTKVAPLLQHQLGISRQAAYRLYDRTQRLFGEMSVKNQQFWLDIELAGLEEDIVAARKLKDYRSVASLRKIKADLIMKTMGSGDALLYEKIQPPPFVIGFFPGTKKVQLPGDKELKKMISDKLKEISEDVEPITGD